MQPCIILHLLISIHTEHTIYFLVIEWAIHSFVVVTGSAQPVAHQVLYGYKVAFIWIHGSRL